MKKRSLLLLLSTLLVSSFVFNGCKKEEETVKKEPSVLTNTKVELPSAMTSSSDQNVSMAASYASTFNSISSYASSLQIPDNATRTTDFSGLKSDEVCYTWSNGSQTVYYLYTESSDKNSWAVYYSDPNYGVEKAKIYYIEESTSSTTGKFEYYNWYSDGSVLMSWNWTETATGIDYEYNGAYQKITASINNDGSGDLQYYSYSNLYYSITWSAAGHGTYTYGDTNGTF